MNVHLLNLILQNFNQEPLCKQTGYGSGFATESKDSDCKLDVSPQSGGESNPYSIELLLENFGTHIPQVTEVILKLCLKSLMRAAYRTMEDLNGIYSYSQ